MHGAVRISAALTMGSLLGAGCLPRNFWADTAGSALSTLALAPANGIAEAVTSFWASLLGIGTGG